MDHAPRCTALSAQYKKVNDLGKTVDNSDMIGKKYGKWVVIGISEKPRYLTCKCECGTIRDVAKSSLTNGLSSCCGCIKPVRIQYTKDPLYKIYSGMKERCINPKHVRYARYGGRGITICEEWLHDPIAFIKWGHEHGYQQGLTLDRIDNDGPYCPDNCRFVDWTIQQNNRSSNHNIVFHGTVKTVTEWAREYNMDPSRVMVRLAKGWDVERALTEPVRQIALPDHNLYYANGHFRTIDEWSKVTGIPRTRITDRVKRSEWSFEEAVSISVRP